MVISATKVELITFILVLSFPVLAAQYTYDNLNRLKTVTYDNGQVIEYTYDAAGNMTSEKISAATAVAVTAIDDHIGISSDNKSIGVADTSWILCIGNGTIKDSISSSDLILGNLPDEFSITVVKGDANNRILITVSGSLNNALSLQQTVSITVKASALNEPGLGDASPVNVYILPYTTETSSSITLTPSIIQEGYNEAQLIVNGTNTNFVQGTTTLNIKDKDGTDVTGGSSVSVSSTTAATITLMPGLLVAGSPYTISLTTGTEAPGAQLLVESTAPADIDAKSVAIISSPLNAGTTSTVTVTLKDADSNLIINKSIDLNIIVIIRNADSTTDEQYTVAGQDCTVSVTIPLTVTSNDSGQIVFDIQLPATIDAGDGLSIQVKTPSGSSIGSAFSYPATDECFIATAAFGSKLQSAVVLLRQFRDKCLLTNTLGQEFVKFYYTNSPPIARCIAQSEPLRAIVRVLLLPLIAVAYTALHPGLLGLVVCMITFLVIYRRKVRNRVVI